MSRALRPVVLIEAEVRELPERGTKEIILIAQDLTHFGEDLKDGSTTTSWRPSLS